VSGPWYIFVETSRPLPPTSAFSAFYCQDCSVDAIVAAEEEWHS